MLQDGGPCRRDAFAANPIVDHCKAAQQQDRCRRRHRQRSVRRHHPARPERKRADTPSLDGKRRDQRGCRDDVGDRIPRSHLVERDAIDVDPVHLGLGLGEMPEDGNRMIADCRVKIGVVQHGADVAPVAMRRRSRMIVTMRDIPMIVGVGVCRRGFDVEPPALQHPIVMRVQGTANRRRRGRGRHGCKNLVFEGRKGVEQGGSEHVARHAAKRIEVYVHDVQTWPTNLLGRQRFASQCGTRHFDRRRTAGFADPVAQIADHGRHRSGDRQTMTFRPKSHLDAGIVGVFAVLTILPAQARPLKAGPTDNVVALTMKTPRGGFNRMVVSVTLCAPGTNRCATIEDVMVDTGSTGLRLEASAIPAFLRLPPLQGPNGAPLGECLRFVHDAAWGPLVRADLHLGALVAPAIAMQIIADGPSQPPQGCPPSHVHPTANGTLGVGPHLFDCPGDCQQVASAPGVFEAARKGWTAVPGRIAPAYRVPNPVTRFPVHNNGIVIDLPAPRPGGEAKVEGTLTIGVDTGKTEPLDTARIVRLDRRGTFTTIYNGIVYPRSYLDSGTMTYILRDAGLSRCTRLPWAFCLDPQRSFAATLVGTDGATVATSFIVGNHQDTSDHHYGAAEGLAVAADADTTAFVWGAPYFLGKRIAIVMEGRSLPGHPSLMGPFFAFE